jgi:hypothetical protein
MQWCGLLRNWLLRRADDIDTRAVVNRLMVHSCGRRWWYYVLLDGALDAEITKAHKEMDAVGTILATGRNITRFDATKEDTEREI